MRKLTVLSRISVLDAKVIGQSKQDDNHDKHLFPDNDEDKKSLVVNRGHTALDNGGPSACHKRGRNYLVESLDGVACQEAIMVRKCVHMFLGIGMSHKTVK